MKKYVSEGTLVKAIQTISQPNNLPPINRTTIENQLNFEGWRHEENSVN